MYVATDTSSFGFPDVFQGGGNCFAYYAGYIQIMLAQLQAYIYKHMHACMHVYSIQHFKNINCNHC